MPNTSSASVRIFWLDRAAVLRELESAARQLKAIHPEVEQVLLFGYTRTEISAMLDRGNPFIRQALTEGILLA